MISLQQLLTDKITNKNQIFIIAVLIVVLDQVTKFFIRANFSLHQSLPVIPDVLNLTFTKNTGAAFSLFTGQVQVLTVISIIAALVVIIFVVVEKSEFYTIQVLSWGVLLGGIIGNLIDRLFLGSVTDFIDFCIINFPIFNLADMFIDIGAITLLFFNLFWIKNGKNEATQDYN